MRVFNERIGGFPPRGQIFIHTARFDAISQMGPYLGLCAALSAIYDAC